MSLPLIIIVTLVGIALVVLEIVALPGAICGIFGGLMMALGIWQSYAHYGNTVGIIFLLVSIFATVILLILMMKTGTWKRFSLNESSDGKTNQVESSGIAVGSRGTSISRLAPAGKAQFGDQLVEVHSEGEFIDESSPLEVIAIEGYKIIVRKAAD